MPCARTKKTSWSVNAAAFTVGRDGGGAEASGPKSRVTTFSGKMAETEVPAESPNVAVGTPPQRGWLPPLRTVTATGKKTSSKPLAGLPQCWVPTANDTGPALTVVGLDRRSEGVWWREALTVGVQAMAQRGQQEA